MTIGSLRYLSVAALLPVAASRVMPVADARESRLPPISTSTAIFEQNVGQFRADVRFAALGARRHSVAITSRGGLQIGVGNAGVAARIAIAPVGSSPAPAIAATEQLPAKVHRFVGSDPSAWRRNIPTAARVRVPELYDGIDLEYYGTERDIEYDFIVAPGADPGVIGLSIAGAEVRRDESGGLILATPAGDVHQRRPIAYQNVAGVRRPVTVEYRVSPSIITFDVGDYDRARPLVIDPILVVSTFRGGSTDDSGRAVTFGPDGLFVAGTADRGMLSGEVFMSDVDTFVAKYSVDGRTLQFITYYGGNMRGPDEPSAIAIDREGVIYVAGNTGSLTLPIAGSAVQTVSAGGRDGFLFRLSPDGASLLLSTYMGSENTDTLADLVLGDDLYIVGSARSNFSSFPIPMAPGPGAGWLVRLTLEGVPLAARRIGGQPIALAVAPGGAVVVAGNGGWATPGAFQTTAGDSICSDSFRTTRGCADGNVARFSPDFSTLEWATFLREASFQRTHAEDLIFDIAVDRSGAVYVTGQTLSTSFPVTPGAYQSTCGFCNPNTTLTGGGTGFVTKLNATGSALVFSTFLGGSGSSTAYSLAIDLSGGVFVTGGTASADFPPVGTPLPSDPSQFPSSDAFITLLNPTGTTAIYSSRFGGLSHDWGRGLSLSRFGTVAVTGETRSSDFPTVNAVQPGFGGGLSDAFVSIISAPRIVTVLESPADGGTTRATSTTLRGFAADTRAVGSPGIDGVHIYAYPNGAGAPIFLGLATAGGQRDDVAGALGDDFATSGFSLTTTLTPGEYLFVAYAHSDVTDAFGDPAIVRARAEAGAQLDLESPAPGPSNQSFVVSGTAVDLDAPTGTGIDTVHVWAYPNPGSGAAARFLGVADYGESRPELEIAYGARFRNAGFSLEVALEPGAWLVVAYGRSTVSQTFSVHKTAAITVRAGQAEIHFETPLGPVVYSGFQINGWARDASAVAGAGFDAIHVWAYPNPGSGAAPVFLGATTTAFGRTDIANTHGLQFLLSGFVIRTAALPAGNYLVVVFARSTVTNRFDVHESRMLEVRVATEAVLQVDTPVNGAVVGATVGVMGHAFDPRSIGHLGVDGVHVWLYPNWGSGEAPIFAGLAFQGLDSPEIGASYGLNFSKTGFQLPVHLPPGSGATHLIAVFAHSNVTGAFTMKTVLVTRQ